MPPADSAGAKGSSPAAAAAAISARVGVVVSAETSGGPEIPFAVGADAVAGTPSVEAMAGDGIPVAGIAPTSAGGAPVVRSSGGDA